MKAKQLIYPLALALVFVMALTTACNKDEDDNGGGGSGGNTMSFSATVAGDNFDAFEFDLASVEAQLVGLTNNMTISGVSSSGQVISISLNNISEQTYDLSPSATVAVGTAIYQDDQEGGIYLANTGTVNLTDYDTANKTISGNFNYTALLSPTTISCSVNGSFANVSYTETP